MCLPQIVTIMSSVDLDECDELDQIRDVESMYKYLYGHGVEEEDELPEICNIVEEVLHCDPNVDEVVQYDPIVEEFFSDPYGILRGILEEISHVEIQDDFDGTFVVDEVNTKMVFVTNAPIENKHATVTLRVGDMPAKVRNKFMCEICEQLLFNNERLKKHYLREHNKVQCKKCGVLLDADNNNNNVKHLYCATYPGFSPDQGRIVSC